MAFLAIALREEGEQTLSVLEVVAPERSDLVLTADVPDREADVLVLHCLDVETCKRETTRLINLQRHKYQWLSRGAVAQSVERPSKVPVWCSSTDVGSNPGAAV